MPAVRPRAILLVVILGIVAFAVLVPIIPVPPPLDPGGGVRYDSISYYTLGVGETVRSVGPGGPGDPPPPFVYVYVVGFILLFAAAVFLIATYYSPTSDAKSKKLTRA